MTYENLSDFEKTLGTFGDRVGLIAGLEVGGKISEEDAFLEIKKLYKGLKKQYRSRDEEDEST
jgi:hypothetical protein